MVYHKRDREKVRFSTVPEYFRPTSFIFTVFLHFFDFVQHEITLALHFICLPHTGKYFYWSNIVGNQ